MYYKEEAGHIAGKEKTAVAAPTGVLPKTTAVIAPRGCVDLYGHEIHEASIQGPRVENHTTFIPTPA